jgi:hypothetical protein
MVIRRQFKVTDIDQNTLSHTQPVSLCLRAIDCRFRYYPAYLGVPDINIPSYTRTFAESRSDRVVTCRDRLSQSTNMLASIHFDSFLGIKIQLLLTFYIGYPYVQLRAI